MTTPPEGTQPPTGPHDPYAAPAGGVPYGSPPSAYGAPPAGAYGTPPPARYGAPPEGHGGAAADRDDRPTDVFSIVGLVLAFLLAPVGLVLSIVGLARTAGGKRKGRGLAIAGVIVSVVLTLLLVAAVVALVALGQFALQESGVTIEELQDLSTAEPFTVEPFPLEP